jgi:signal transduction histidine kinase
MDATVKQNPAHILIVDDEPVIRELCKRTLEMSGNRIEDAESGEKALALLKSKAYDLVLTDLIMPGNFGGEKLLEEVKHTSPGTDVIIMTGVPTLKTAIPALKNGAYDYLMKPLDQAFLRSVVSQCLEKRRLFRELDRERSLREELSAAYSQLQELEHLKEAFISRVNHELRIPLTPLFMALEQLREEASNSKSRALCALLEDRARRLQEVIENVLLFSDLRDPGFRCSKKDLNVKHLLMSIVTRYRVLWEEKHLIVDIHWESETEWQTLDPNLVETAFRNLFLNAIHFNKRHGKITIRARKAGDKTEISFADTGIGIPANKLSQIFDSFYQVADYLTREVGGIGVGLTLVRRIMELHGGTVRIESVLGEGSTFCLSFPKTQ